MDEIIFAVISSIASVTPVISEGADRLGGVRVETRGIEEEIEFMASLLERSEAQNQIHDDEIVTKIKGFINEADTLFDDYATVASDRAAGGVRKKIYLQKKQWRCAKKLKGFIVKVGDYKPKLTEYDRVLREQGLPEDDQRELVPRYLWRFIYYFLLFPLKMDVPVRRLIFLWIAEGLINSRDADDDTSVEDIAERYLERLINLGVVCVKKYKLNGRPQACSLRARDNWWKEAKEDNFFQSRTKQVCRLVDHIADADIDADVDASFIKIHRIPKPRSISSSVPEYGDVISFSSFDTQEGSNPGEDIGKFIHKCIVAERFLWLKMLDLEKVFRPKLPATLGRLTRLKYLGLRWTYVQHLPGSVNRMLQLQVLDVKHTRITLLPASIWRMKGLRHLYLSEAYRTKFPDRPSGKVSLTQLQTLWGAFIDEDTHVKQGLDTQEDIRKLGLSCRPSSGDSDMSEQLQAVDKWISKQGKLRSLRLKSRDNKGEPAPLHLTTLEMNTNLSAVYLLGKLNPQVVEKFPHSLTDITLSGSELDMDPMGLLGNLPNLVILRLLANSVVGPKLHCSRGGFPGLKVIDIWCLEKLEEWEVEEGSLPCLESLEIRSCPNLKNLPLQLNTLQKLWLTSMPDRFLHETELRQPQLWARIKHGRRADEQQQQL